MDVKEPWVINLVDDLAKEFNKLYIPVFSKDRTEILYFTRKDSNTNVDLRITIVKMSENNFSIQITRQGEVFRIKEPLLSDNRSNYFWDLDIPIDTETNYEGLLTCFRKALDFS